MLGCGRCDRCADTAPATRLSIQARLISSSQPPVVPPQAAAKRPRRDPASSSHADEAAAAAAAAEEDAQRVDHIMVDVVPFSAGVASSGAAEQGEGEASGSRDAQVRTLPLHSCMEGWRRCS